jgi:hypothetical protein
MPATDCALLWNLLPAEYGLRARLGYVDHVTGLTGEVRTVIPFYGSVASKNRLFAATEYGITDVTNSGVPGSSIAFGINSGDAGRGTFHAFVTFAGHFLVYADGENGYYLYSEANDSWVKVASAASTPWVAGATYGAGDRVSSNGVTYQTAAGGVAGSTAPTGAGTGISDGAVLWDYTPTISGVDPAEVVGVAVWKHRVFLIMRGSAIAAYLELDAVLGPATKLSFAGRFQHGGALRGLWNWTGDGGSGIDDMLVGVSDGGDVVIYQGVDPATPGAFELKGVWYVGGIPKGRRIATEVGGDLLLLTKTGAVSLSKLQIGNPIVDRTQYATYKIGNLYNSLVQQYGGYNGWQIYLHPEDNALVINVPSAEGKVSEQLVMAVTTRAWSRYSYPGLTICSADPFEGKVYFGTTDGRVLKNSGYADAGTENIEFFLLTSYQKLGSANQKRVHMIRSNASSLGAAPVYRVKAVSRYSLEQFTGGTSISELSGDKFDEGLFDTAVFSGVSYAVEQRLSGGGGTIGPEVAIAMSGKASAKTEIIGWDVLYDEGGWL